MNTKCPICKLIHNSPTGTGCSSYVEGKDEKQDLSFKLSGLGYFHSSYDSGKDDSSSFVTFGIDNNRCSKITGNNTTEIMKEMSSILELDNSSHLDYMIYAMRQLGFTVEILPNGKTLGVLHGKNASSS